MSIETESRPGWFERMARAARALVVLGWIVFLGGWAGIVYLMIDTSENNRILFEQGAQGRVYLAVSSGSIVTIAAALLWGVAFTISMRLAAAHQTELGRGGEER